MKMMQSIRLTDNQKRVLAKIVAAPTPKVAGDDISGDAGLVSARDLLTKLGVMTYNNNEAAVTEKGQQMMKDEALTDDSGQLTADGEKYAHADDEGKQEEPPAAPPNPFGGPPPGAPPIGMPGEAPPIAAPTLGGPPAIGTTPGQGTFESEESFHLLKELLKR